MEDYDEDVSQNAFYRSLQKTCPQLYDTATENRWMICVPQSSVVSQYTYSEKDFENHILIPVHDAPNQFTTVSNKSVNIQDNNISTGTGFSDLRKVPVLFEETFFNRNDESYYVLCISVPLEGGPVDLGLDTPVVMIKNLEDCKDMLWGHTGNEKTQKQLNDITASFNGLIGRLEGQSVRQHMDAANAMFTKAMQTVLKDAYLKKMARQSKPFMDTLKVAVETYIMHKVYARLFKGISGCLASKDAKLNKTTRNLSELQLRDLGVKQDFCHNVPRARREMTSLNRYSTPIGKLYCIKRVVKAIMTPHKAAAKDEDSTALTTDDLLPILVFLVVKSEVPNWWANLTFMTCFRFSKSSNDDEFGFFLASMEAAIEHVGAGELDSIKLGSANPQKMQLSISPSQNSDGMWMRQDSMETSSIDRFYQHIKDNNGKGVTEMLTKASKRNHGDIVLNLCHPLCSCDRCEQLITQSRNDASLVTVFSRDDQGCTALHIAAQFGHTGMLELLINHGAAVDATDYHGYSPLHSACMKGNQSAALLLLHFKADVNLQDNDGHTPLHLAASNGHEECVKALVYYDQGVTSLQMNVGNDFGNTPLHLAAKWGYVAIVDILLDNGALVDVKNRKKLTPYHYAHNVKVAGLLRKAQETSGLPRPKPLLFSQVPVNKRSPSSTLPDPNSQNAKKKKVPTATLR